MHDEDTQLAEDGEVTFGLLAQFKDPTALVVAAKKINKAGYSQWDAYSPFPVHGIDPAMGIKPTILPWLVLGGGLAGLFGGLLLQWWTNAVDYPFVISGKPIFSLPANIPVIFESTVLVAGLTAFFGMLVLNLLPQLYHPLFRKERFRRVTSDGFFIAIEAKDPKFSPATADLLREAGAIAVEQVMDEPRRAYTMPRGLVYGGIIAVVATFLPLALVAKARYTKTREPRYHVFFDMDNQPYRAQSTAPFFEDHSTYRPPVEGTLARDELKIDEHYYLGKDGNAWATTFPEQVPLTAATMERGRDRFAIFCAPCHGAAGGGDGMVARRAAELKDPKWVPPANLHDPRVRQLPVGELFNTISNGIRNMPSYSAQIPEADRWAIIMYVKALERSQYAQLEDVPADKRQTLR